MPYNVLLIPLLGGYYILSNFEFFKYKYQRVSSQRLIFNSALAGIFVSFFSFLFRFGFEKVFPSCFNYLSRVVGQIFLGSPRYIWTMLVGLLIIIALTHFSNWIISKISGLKGLPIRNAIKNYGNEIEQLCLASIEKGFALQITLKNDKVYVGFIDEAPIPSKTNYLLFTPLYSGFRDSATKKLSLNTSYQPVIESLIADDLAEKQSIMNLVIKQDEILTMSPHDPDVFIRFSSGA